MKNIFYLLLLSLFLTGCGDDPFSKVKSENVEQAAARDNSPSKFPVMVNLQLEYKFHYNFLWRL